MRESKLTNSFISVNSKKSKNKKNGKTSSTNVDSNSQKCESNSNSNSLNNHNYSNINKNVNIKIKKNQIDNLSLVEQDIHHKIIYKRFKILQESECILFNIHFQKYPNDSYEGYCLYFWQASEKLFVIYPFGYILIYDCNSADLLYHFQSTIGKHLKINKINNPMGRSYALQNIVGSPIENCLFVTCENRYYFYCIDYSLINKEKGKCSIYDLFENKIAIPKDTRIYDIIVHPNQKFLYAGFSDGIVRVYDYNDIKNIKQLTTIIREFNVNISVKGAAAKTLSEGDPVVCLDINNIGSYLLEGTSKGHIYLWDAYLANKNKKNTQYIIEQNVQKLDTIISKGDSITFTLRVHASVGIGYELDYDKEAFMTKTSYQYVNPLFETNPCPGGDAQIVTVCLTAQKKGEFRVMEIENYRGVRTVKKIYGIRVK